MTNQKRTDTIGEAAPIRGRRAAVKKRYWIIALILILGCTAYWVKGQLGINLFQSMSTSSHFPFNYLHDNVLTVRNPGTVIDEDFEQSSIFNRWSDSNFHGDPKIVYKIIQGGPGNPSRYLQISSHRDSWWVYKFSKYISVTKGDLFQIKGRLHVQPANTKAMFSIAGFDADKNPIDWRMAARRVIPKGSWVEAEKQFSITDDKIQFISFRLMGHRGVYRFDDLFLNKLDGPVFNE